MYVKILFEWFSFVFRFIENRDTCFQTLIFDYRLFTPYCKYCVTPACMLLDILKEEFSLIFPYVSTFFKCRECMEGEIREWKEKIKINFFFVVQHSLTCTKNFNEYKYHVIARENEELL